MDFISAGREMCVRELSRPGKQDIPVWAGQVMDSNPSDITAGGEEDSKHWNCTFPKQSSLVFFSDRPLFLLLARCEEGFVKHCSFAAPMKLLYIFDV